MVRGDDRAGATRQLWLRRKRERGATLFVVVLVITLLMGIGVYAARSAHMSIAASGNERQMVQARYIAEYGLLIAQSKLANGGGQSYLNAMRPPSGTVATTCSGQTGMVAPTCLKLFKSDIQTEIGNPLNLNVCEPGSLGSTSAECDFSVELTEKTAGLIPAGFAQSSSQAGANTLKFWYVTATVTGWVRLAAAKAGQTDATSLESASMQVLRGRILAGPFN